MTPTELKIERAKEKINKITKKINQINEALNGGKDSYYYTDRDLKAVNRELNDAHDRLNKLIVKKSKEELELSERCSVIEDFLGAWENRAISYYEGEYSKFQQQGDLLKNKKIDYDEYKNNLKSISSVIIDCSQWGTKWHERLESIVAREKNNKRTSLMNKIKKLAGKIIDASWLRISDNGMINGLIVGEVATVSVNTIDAGGYNIQCFHYRTLVKVIDDKVNGACL